MAELGSGSVQNWTTDVRAVLGEAHDVVQAAKASGNSAQDPTRLAGLRTRYDRDTAFGRTHHRHRDWHVGNHPGYALARWLADHVDEVWLSITAFEVEWTNNASERAIKDPKRHQAVSGYWQTQQTLGQFCRIRSYLTSARNDGVGVIDAIHADFTGTAGSPPQPQPDHTASPS